VTGPATPGESQERPLRVVLVDDSSLFRKGLAALLDAAGLKVVAELGDAVLLPDAIWQHTPHAVVLDARMPPSHTDEGIRAALQVRKEFPGVGVLVLSTYAEGTWANQLFSAGATGLGYLLKDRVNDTTALTDAIRTVSTGGAAVDPEVVERLLAVTNHRSVLDALSERERAVLCLMAQGRSNAGIGRSLHLSPRTVETYVASIFVKLPLDTDDSATNRRVLAVLAYLQDRGRS
jgi:DNA-binding NarL/FixJ family response regulator